MDALSVFKLNNYPNAQLHVRKKRMPKALRDSSAL